MFMASIGLFLASVFCPSIPTGGEGGSAEGRRRPTMQTLPSEKLWNKSSPAKPTHQLVHSPLSSTCSHSLSRAGRNGSKRNEE